MPRIRKALLASLLVVMALACATGRQPGGLNAPPAARLAVFDEGVAPADEALALAEKLYAGAPLDEIDRALPALLARYPGDPVVHEVAAYASLMHADVDGAWEHFMRAAQDPGAAAVEHYLEEGLLYNRTLSERTATIAFLDDLAKAHPIGAVRARAAYHLITELSYVGDVGKRAARAREAIGFLERWQTLGSFDNDQGKAFLPPLPPERGVDLAAVVPGARLSIGWRPVDVLEHNGRVPLGWIHDPSADAAAYVVTWVQSPRDIDAELRVTTGSPTRAWVNDHLVLSAERVDRSSFDNLAARIHLKEGWNQVLVKSAHRRGNWHLGARLTDRDGAPIKGLKTSLRPRKYASEPGETLQDAHASLLGGAELRGEARAAFLRARGLTLLGHDRPSVHALQAFVSKHPESLPGLYYAAVALQLDEEEGKSIDLLNRAIELTEGKAPRFLHRRARFYRGKDLHDRAQADLEKVLETASRARVSAVELSQVLNERGFQVERCEVLRDVLARWPDDAWAMREEGLCLEARGYRREALARFEEARHLEPGHLWGLGKLLDYALESQQLDLAYSIVKKRQEVAPQNLSYLLKEGDILRWQGRPDRARTVYEEVVSHAPDWSPPYAKLARLERERGDRERAAGFLEAALDRNPDSSQLANLLDYLSPEGLGLAENYVPDDKAVTAAVARARDFTPHPGAHVVMLMDDEVTEVSNEGSAKRVVTQVAMALTKRGRDQLIQASVPHGGRTRLLQSYVLHPDGERQEASSIRGGQVRFRSLKVGSITVLQYVHYARPQRFLPNHYTAEWYFQGVDRQFLDSRWVLITGADRTLNVSVQGDVKESKETIDGHTVRTFHAENVPPLMGERFMPPARDLLHKVSVSTVDGWEEYVSWERALLSQVFKLDDETRALARKLVEGAKTPREKFDRLYHYVSQEIRYQQDYETTIAGVRPHACPVVLARGYGDCKDKAVLLILLAKEVGLDVDFAILRTTNAGAVQRDIPNQQFNHAIVYVPKQDGIEEPFFMDPTTDGLDMGNLRADDQGATSLVLDPETGKWAFHKIPLQSPELDYAAYDVTIEVKDRETARAVVHLEMRGNAASRIRQLLRSGEQARKFYQALGATILPGAVLVEGKSSDHDDIWHPLTLDLVYDVSKALQPQGDDTRLALPTPFPLKQTASLDDRRHPIRLGHPDSQRMNVKVKLPRGATTVHMPEELKVEHPCFEVKRSAEKKDSTLTFDIGYQRSCFELPAEQYPDYREAVQRAHGRLQDPLVLQIPEGKLAGR